MFRQAIKPAILFYLLIFVLAACHQERIVFNAESLPQDFKFEFDNPFKEVIIDVDEVVKINGLLFKADNSKGLVFYLHGNSGKLNTWGTMADFYLKNSYDFFIIDYRSFGKSTGLINKEDDMYNDIQVVYDSLQSHFNYHEEDIVLIGYSIGTGFAAKLASDNNPKQLILKAPYYSIPNLINQSFKAVPHFLFKYKLPTYKYMVEVKAPIAIFHGDNDKVIPIKSSYKLEKKFKLSDTLFVLPNQNHRGINANKIYISEMNKILK
jgi:alpha-beta hydrolase superfamily lysophospholipase